MTYQEAIACLKESSRKGSRPGLERMNELLGRLDNPQESLKVIHVAGTNGKGSTVKMLEQVLISAGYSVGTFTSPYLSCIREQILQKGELISEDDFAEMIGKVYQVSLSMKDSPTEFELVTAAAYLYFNKKQFQLVLVECGMGGKMDATNVITAPLVSAITTIGIDHTAFLGNTLEEIATHKAGIIKKGCPTISYQQSPSAKAVIEQVCREQNSPLYLADFEALRIKEATLRGQIFDYCSKTEQYAGLKLPLLGEHQRKNAALALKTLEVIKKYGYSISEDVVKQGLSKSFWPARMEVLNETPLVILDGGHNVQGISAVTSALKESVPGQKFIVVTGVMRDKDYYEMYRLLLPFASEIIAVRPENIRALSAEELCDIIKDTARQTGCKNTEFISSFRRIEDGFRHACARAKAEQPVLVVGSLYMAGEIRRIARELFQK